MSKENLPAGTLPHDAQLRLKAASQVGRPGSIARRSAINRAYKWIDTNYPEYLKKKDEQGNG